MTDKKSDSGIQKQADGTITFKLTMSKDKVKEAYSKALKKAVEVTEIKGFRKGKAPENLVETQLGKQKLYTQALQYALPEAYSQNIKKLNLKPITNPQIDPESLEEGKDWILKVTIAEKPEIKLGDYKKVVSGAKATSKIWVPGQEKPAPDKQTDKSNPHSQDSTDEKLAKIFDALIEHVRFEIPKFIIDEETGRLLSRLVDQLQRLGVTLDQYLMSLGKSSEVLRKEYKDQSERTLRLEFILNEISHDLKIAVEDKEIDDLINSVGDEKLKKQLNTPSERLMIRESLKKRKVTESLLKM